MSNEKLSELSKPVTVEPVTVETVRERLSFLEDLNARGVGTAVRSQQFEISCLRELLAAEQRIAELELDELAMQASSRAVHEAQKNHINQQQDRIESLEKKNSDLGQALGVAEKRLATPVRLPELCGDGENDTEYTEGLNDGINQSANAVRSAGFKCVGYE